jgi:capsular exopolysaccharide synthesis family protein
VDIRDYLRVLTASWALLLLGAVLGAGVAAGLSRLAVPEYTTETQLFVTTSGSEDLSTAVQGNYYAEGKVASYAELLRSKQLATDVVTDLGLSLSPQDVIDRVTVEVVTDTTILDVSVTDTSPTRALAVATSIDRRFQAMVRELETPEGESTSPVRVTVIAAPELPTAASSPAVRANIALGTALGLVLAALIAIIRDRLDTTVKDDEEAASLAGAPVIGHLPVSPELSGETPPSPHSTSPGAEAVRHVRTNLAFLDVDHPPRVIMVTSSVPGEGKTTLAVNLAVALAESGNRVTLVDADLRRPRVTRYLGLVAGVGLTNVLTGSAAIAEVTQPVGDGGLDVLAAGPPPPNPSELLSSEAMAALVAELASTRDIVVIDTPPLLPVADASAVAGLADGVLLCARWGSVDADQLQRSGAILDRLGAKLLGVVMTQVPGRSAVAYGYEAEVPITRPGPLRRIWSRGSATAPLGPVAAVRPRSAAGTTAPGRGPIRPVVGSAALADISER